MKKAIILVAGKGTRLQPRTLSTHKCLTEVNGTPILKNALTILDREGIEEVVLVVGYLAGQIKETMGESFSGMKLTYVTNDIYDKTNTSASLLMGVQAVKDFDELYILEGDVFFSPAVFDRLKNEEAADATVLEPYNTKLDGTFASIDESEYVTDWCHKSMRPEGYTLEDKFKTVNIHKFGSAFTEGILKPALEKSVSEKAGRDPLENVMMGIVRKDPRAVKGVVLRGEKWFEIDDSTDLAEAERIFR